MTDFSVSNSHTTEPAPAREFFIQGVTSDGKTFRPSDWPERLCGAMACFRPASSGLDAHLRYSPYVLPVLLEGIKSVAVKEQLRQIEPLAYHFVLDFAHDNDLRIVEACLLPDVPQSAPQESKAA